MSENIKKLVKRLRQRTVLVNYGNGNVGDVPDTDCNDAADELEALAGEVEWLPAWKDMFTGVEKQNVRAEAAEADRDRLKAALEEIKTMPTRIYQNHSTAPTNKILFEAQQFVAGACAAIARKALGDAS